MMLSLISSETVTIPGLYRQSEKSYHSDPCPVPSLSRSIAEKLILESPMHAQTAHPRMTLQDDEEALQDDEEEKNSRVREIGSAAHAMLLGQPTELAVIAYDNFKKKVAQEERSAAQARGAIPLLTKDFEIVQAMAEKARRVLAGNEHAAIRALAGQEKADQTYNEVTAAWIDRCGDHWARARLDRISRTEKLVTVIDYKTTKLSVSPFSVSTAIYNNNYHFQDSFYRRGVRALFPEIDRHEMRLDFLFVMQEQQAPFEITVARVDPAGRVIGEKMVSAAFMLWRKCHAENWWPGYPGGITDAEMPARVDTKWTSRELEDPYLQGLGNDPMPFYENQPYRPKPIMEPN
jgi:hypothetical protein